MAGVTRELPRGSTAACSNTEPHERHLWPATYRGLTHPVACPGVELVAEPGPPESGLIIEAGDVLLLGIGDLRIPVDQIEALRTAVLRTCPGLAGVLFLPGPGTAVYRAAR